MENVFTSRKRVTTPVCSLLLEGAKEAHSYQVTALSVGDSHQPGAQTAHGLRADLGGRKGRHRYLQGKTGRRRQIAARGQKNSPGTDVQRGRKLEEFLSAVVDSPDKNGNGKGQSLVFPSFFGAGLCSRSCHVRETHPRLRAHDVPNRDYQNQHRQKSIKRGGIRRLHRLRLAGARNGESAEEGKCSNLLRCGGKESAFSWFIVVDTPE